MIPYIDVRGPVPILFIGYKAYRLIGLNRRVTVEQAIEHIKDKLND